MNNIQKCTNEIITNMKTKYMNEDGLMSSRYPPDHTNLLDHMEDYTPFMLHFGENGFVKSQLVLSQKYTHAGLFCDKHRIVSYLNNEYLSALFHYFKARPEDDVKSILQTSLRSIFGLLLNNNFIKTYYDTAAGRAPHITSPMTGALLEVLLCNYQFSTAIRPLAIKILNSWLEIPFFQKYGLFPSKHYTSSPSLNRFFLKEHLPIPNKIKNRFEVNFCTFGSWVNNIYRLPWGVKVQLCKDNTNMIFALIEAYKLVRDTKYKTAIVYWINNVWGKLFRNGLLHRFWHPTNKIEHVELTGTFAVIDILCDFYYFVEADKKYLNFAEEIARPWLQNSMWSNGLLPRIYRGCRNHLDDQTDFCISMLRLFELTGKIEYHNTAERLRESILHYHYTKDGYVTSVDINGIKLNKIEPKYNALLLKLLILSGENKKIYGDDYTHQLVKDR